MELLKEIKRISEESKKLPFIIGIEGGIGSGKSYTAKKLKESLGEKAITMNTDNFINVGWDEWKERVEKGGIILKDWWGLSKLKETLERINKKEKFTIKGLYNLADGQFTKEIEFDISSCKYLILEGHFAFEFEELLDLKIFLNIPEEIALERAEKRDKIDRGFSHNKWIIKKTIFHDNYLSYLKNLKNKADIVYNG